MHKRNVRKLDTRCTKRFIAFTQPVHINPHARARANRTMRERTNSFHGKREMERSRFSEKSTLVGKLITAFSSYWEYVYLTYFSDRQKRANALHSGSLHREILRCAVPLPSAPPLSLLPSPSLSFFPSSARCTRRKGVKLTHDL